ncbi:PIN2/TERF1-interacting telomerase inhibitor 1 isoform X1 [Drosophila pseudoobscura]|uniref:PIN2/TERF1-interacting telomerase inhibitor 1 isoform X1 n=1 Tax=Drosophila pseudoobscura pseudoobscura TaxID=46245 RepID=A0A6I8V490_DROPS|nr:PIN2/TERF1-interacting telomerase inhibitor 1 isoform X1 [Drosophila pseudoobscura]
MAMLAEPRRRKRYNLCPRGKALYEDDARFGTKMLEKMGWSKGKGLGANEDGQRDFVRVRLKNDAEGLGFEARDDQWTVHEEGFSGLLKSLNGGTDETNGTNGAASASEDEARPMGFGFKAAEPEEPPKKKLKERISGISLEEASKASKARVHYKKFTRGKDLSQYSEKDLANIFGKKATEEIDAPVKIELTQVEEKEINPNFSGVTTVATGLSVHDYFKQKLEAMKNKIKNGSGNTLTQSPRTDEEVQTESAQSEPIKKKKKKDKERTAKVPAEEEENVEPKQKKKKSKRASDQQVEQSDTTAEDKPVEVVSLHETSAKTKKKSKETRETIANVLEEESLKKKKKSRKDKKVAETKEDAESEAATAVPDDSENTSPSKSKKKKRSKETVDSLSEPVGEETNKASGNTPEDKNESPEAPLKKKKKSKKVVEEEEQSVTPVLDKAEKSSKKKNKLGRDVPEDSAPAAVTGKKHKDSVSAEPKSSGDKSDQSADEDQHEELLSLDEIKEKIKSFNIYTISQFCADKFQMFDMNAFRESSLAEITGYGCSANMELRVEEMKNDDKRIMDLWKNESYASYKKSDRFTNTRYPNQVKRTTLRAVKKRFAFQAI